ncbi:MAG: restriction endonuclease subunit S [Parcubacteria group bacterium]|nr:restriction endonuclease subunit S [Parcubacteria group bacterium]
MTNKEVTTIGSLFDVEYGQKEYESKSFLEGEYGNIPLISSKGDENGVYDFYNIKSYYKAPFITVPRVGTIGQAFVQDKDCCVDNNCMVLLPKKDINIEKLYQIAYQIRLNKWKYKYGRQITPKRIKLQEIRLIDSKIDYEKFVKEITPKKKAKAKIKENKNIKLVPVIYLKDKQENGLCELHKKTALPQNQLENGKTPYVTTSSKNNGVSGYYDEEPNFKGRCLTVALNGSVGETFFQFDDFITSGDNVVLKLKDEYNPYLLFYISVMIKNHQWRYNYYRKLNLTKLKKMTIPVPFKSEKELDLEYIKNIVENSYGFDELRKYL